MRFPTINPGHFPAAASSHAYDVMGYQEESSGPKHVVSSEAIKNLQGASYDKRLNTITADMADANGIIPAHIGPFAEYNRMLEQRELSSNAPADPVPGKDCEVMSYHEETALDVAHCPIVTREMIWKLRENNRNIIRADMADESGKLPAEIGTFAHINLNPTTIWSKGSRTLD